MSSQKKIELRGKEYTVSPLTLNQIRDLSDDFKTVRGIRDFPNDEEGKAVVRVVHASLSTEHEGLSEKQVGDLIDLGNMLTVLAIVFGRSGFESTEGNAPAR